MPFGRDTMRRAVAGIFLGAGNTTWTIRNNSFYQTRSRRTLNTSRFSAVNISGTAGKNFNVLDAYRIFISLLFLSLKYNFSMFHI